MKLVQVLSLSIVTTLIAVLPAIAGSSVSNTRTHRVTRGTGSVVTNFSREASSIQVNKSQGIKMDAEGGDVNIVDVHFNGTNFTATGHSSNQVPVDPFVAATYTTQREIVRSNETLSQQAVENYRFKETMNDLTVTSDSF